MADEVPNLPVANWQIDKIKPYYRNSKLHDPEQVSKIAKAIKEFGWDQPIVVDGDGVIIKGHGRRLAALELGMTFVPVIVRTDLTKAQVKASRIADNRVAQGDQDTEMLHDELAELADLSIDMSTLGFDDSELAFMTEDLGEIDDSALMTDLEEETNAASERSEAKVKEAGERMVSLGDAFGFKTVTAEQSRVLKRFVTQIEADMGKTGADALAAFATALLGSAD